MAADLTPYRVDVPQADVDDLYRRIDATRLPETLPDANWGDGIIPDRIRQLLHHWRHDFDWRAIEADINSRRQIITEIDGTTIHAQHIQAATTDRPPIVLLHGWPSSIREFHKLIDPLSHPQGSDLPAFDLIVPSIPGYGFSGPTRERGWGADRMADAIDELVNRLGYDRYIVHGGDVGYEIATALGQRHPDRVAGLHLNLGGVRLAGEHRSENPANERQRIAFERYDEYTSRGSAYALLQATRPQTIAYALTDSPVAQLAWTAEKFHEWADPKHPVDDDDVLTAVSITWFTKTAGSSARFYQESYGKWAKPNGVIAVPTAIASFPGDIVPPVREWAEQKFTIDRWIDMPEGGHFSALETPGLLSDSIRAFGANLS